VVFPCPKRGRYFGFRLAGATHKEKPSWSGWVLLAPPTLAAPEDLLATAASRSHNQRPGGWRYHPARRSRTGTDEMRNHRIW
jgi:hypothetical protein